MSDKIQENTRPLYRSAAGHQAIRANYETILDRWTTQTEVQYIRTRHGRTYLYALGEPHAPPLMLFHDWGQHVPLVHLYFNLPLLARHFRLFLPDLIGQAGRSAINRPSATSPAYAEWVEDLFDLVEIDRATLLGVGGGGFVALKAASHLPDRINRALLINPLGLLPPPLLPPWRVLRATLRSLRTGVDPITALLTPPDHPATDAHHQLVDALISLRQHFRPAPYPAALTLAELHSISAPVYLILGRDAYQPTPQPTALHARRHLTDLQVELVAPAGQFPTLDQPGLVEHILLNFCGLTPPPPTDVL